MALQDLGLIRLNEHFYAPLLALGMEVVAKNVKELRVILNRF